MRPNPCISQLYTLRHFFFYFKFKRIYIYNRESPIAVCIYKKDLAIYTSKRPLRLNAFPLSALLHGYP